MSTGEQTQQWRNHALLAKQTELNEFTTELARRCKEQGSCLVRLRNGELVEVTARPPQRGEMEDTAAFRAKEKGQGRWCADGSAFRSKDFDIIDIVT